MISAEFVFLHYFIILRVTNKGPISFAKRAPSHPYSFAFRLHLCTT